MSQSRNYISTSDVSGATDAQVALAEEIIDQYVGPQPRYINIEYEGEVSSHSSKVITDTSDITQLDRDDNYFDKCVIEIMSGQEVGKVRHITDSDKGNKSITYTGDALSNLAVGDIFKIYQLAKFPRRKDVFSRTVSGEVKLFKSIPRAVIDACIAQGEYILEMGDNYFEGDSTDKNSESLGNYSYSRGGERSAIVNMTAPKARMLLRGIMNRKGRLEV